MLIYLDASALLRVLSGTRLGAAPPPKADVVTSSDLLEVEVRRALERAHLAGKLEEAELDRKIDEAMALIDTFHLFPPGDEVIRLARPRFPVDVGALGALHVATAQLVEMEARQRVQFWTHVAAVASAGSVRGLDVRGNTGRA